MQWGRHPSGRQTPLLGDDHPLLRTDTPPQILWDMVNKRAVRILLECIFILFTVTPFAAISTSFQAKFWEAKLKYFLLWLKFFWKRMLHLLSSNTKKVLLYLNLQFFLLSVRRKENLLYFKFTDLITKWTYKEGSTVLQIYRSSYQVDAQRRFYCTSNLQFFSLSGRTKEVLLYFKFTVLLTKWTHKGGSTVLQIYSSSHQVDAQRRFYCTSNLQLFSPSGRTKEVLLYFKFTVLLTKWTHKGGSTVLQIYSSSY